MGRERAACANCCEALECDLRLNIMDCMRKSMNGNTEGDTAQELEWPKFRWRISSWVVVISLLISLISSVPNLLKDMSIRDYLLLVGLIFLALLVAISTIPWISRTVVIMVRRVQYYPRLLAHTGTLEHDLTEAKKIVADVVQSRIEISRFPIVRAAFNKDKLYITLHCDVESNLSTGEKIRVIDSRDGMPMGIFEVTGRAKGGYYAMGIDVDPVWLGQVRSLTETEVTPGLLAIRLSKGGE